LLSHPEDCELSALRPAELFAVVCSLRANGVSWCYGSQVNGRSKAEDYFLDPWHHGYVL